MSPPSGIWASAWKRASRRWRRQPRWLQRQLAENKGAALAGATPFGRLFGLAAGGVLLAKGALAAARGAEGADAGARAIEARHFAESLMCETDGLKQAVTHSYETVMQADSVLGAR